MKVWQTNSARYLIVVSFLFLIQVQTVYAGQLSSSLGQYQETTKAALANEKNKKVEQYLRSCLTASNSLNGLEAGSRRLQAALTSFVTGRLGAAGELTPDTSGAESVRIEKQAYDKYIQPYRKAEYVSLISLQDQLLERKYFKTETAKNANFLEGYINGHWSLTRADHSDVKRVLAEPHLGVSPWEAIFRLEPALAFNGGAQVAILGTAGLSYTFFPSINREKSPPSFDESFLSKWVEKTGGRIGVGVGHIHSDTRLLVGGGVQINALGLWGLYEPDDRIFMLGVSSANLGKLKKGIPLF